MRLPAAGGGLLPSRTAGGAALPWGWTGSDGGERYGADPVRSGPGGGLRHAHLQCRRLEATSGALPGPDGCYRIAEGEEQPPLYLFSTRVDTRGETAAVTVRLRKEYCRLQLGFKAPADCGLPLGLRVVGEVAGCDPAGEPLPGAFSVETAPDAAGRAAVRLPRQRDASLLLQLLYKDRVMRTFALGEYILAAGFDWEAPSLQDMAVDIDIALTNLSLSGEEEPLTEQIDVLI